MSQEERIREFRNREILLQRLWDKMWKFVFLSIK